MASPAITGGVARPNFGSLLAGYIWFFVYNKPHVDYQETDAAYVGQAIKKFSDETCVFSSPIMVNEDINYLIGTRTKTVWEEDNLDGMKF